MMKPFTKSLSCAMVGASLLLISGAQAAQAPVYNLSNESVAEKLANLERIVNSRTRNQQRVQEQIDGMQSEISEIRGRIEEQNYQIEKILQRQRELLLAFDIQSQQLQDASELSNDELAKRSLVTGRATNTNAASAGSPTTKTAVSAVISSTPSAATGNDEAAYKAAVDLILKQRDTKAAIPALEEFVTTYPQSKFTSNAHYWLGQIFYNEQNWEQARVQFDTLHTQYPSSSKVPDATLKLGIIAKNLSDRAKAREYFESVVANHANTTSAKLAQEQINLL
ncbi:MAG: tol-pal system protein YbgF [Glaciecola sp.]|jgi:tol-pal system protein YbgF|nr:tol-pal system protein YbgF [Glaciecola sp.]